MSHLRLVPKPELDRQMTCARVLMHAVAADLQEGEAWSTTPMAERLNLAFDGALRRLVLAASAGLDPYVEQQAAVGVLVRAAAGIIGEIAGDLESPARGAVLRDAVSELYAGAMRTGGLLS